MQTPRYYFSGDFTSFEDYFLSRPHKRVAFRRGELLWEPGEPFCRIHYMLSGLSMHYAQHESGRRRIISFHGPGTVYPGYHRRDYRIELSLVTEALSDIEALEFTPEQFSAMFEESPALAQRVVDWYSAYTNLFLFDSVHQEYNSSLTRLCNLLYLLTDTRTAPLPPEVTVTQDEMADILGISRVHLTRALAELRDLGIVSTSRRCVHILDRMALSRFCSAETV